MNNIPPQEIQYLHSYQWIDAVSHAMFTSELCIIHMYYAQCVAYQGVHKYADVHNNINSILYSAVVVTKGLFQLNVGHKHASVS